MHWCIAEQQVTALVYYSLKCTKGVSAKIFGLLKTHENVLPELLFFVGTPTCNVSSHLANILTPILQNEYSVKNSDFVDSIHNFFSDDQDCFISSDGANLFMSILASLAVDIILHLSSHDTSVKDCTKLTAGGITEAQNLFIIYYVFILKFFILPRL